MTTQTPPNNNGYRADHREYSCSEKFSFNWGSHKICVLTSLVMALLGGAAAAAVFRFYPLYMPQAITTLTATTATGTALLALNLFASKSRPEIENPVPQVTEQKESTQVEKPLKTKDELLAELASDCKAKLQRVQTNLSERKWMILTGVLLFAAAITATKLTSGTIPYLECLALQVSFAVAGGTLFALYFLLRRPLRNTQGDPQPARQFGGPQQPSSQTISDQKGNQPSSPQAPKTPIHNLKPQEQFDVAFSKEVNPAIQMSSEDQAFIQKRLLLQEMLNLAFKIGYENKQLTSEEDSLEKEIEEKYYFDSTKIYQFFDPHALFERISIPKKRKVLDHFKSDEIFFPILAEVSTLFWKIYFKASCTNPLEPNDINKENSLPNSGWNQNHKGTSLGVKAILDGLSQALSNPNFTGTFPLHTLNLTALGEEYLDELANKISTSLRYFILNRGSAPAIIYLHNNFSLTDKHFRTIIEGIKNNNYVTKWKIYVDYQHGDLFASLPKVEVIRVGTPPAYAPEPAYPFLQPHLGASAPPLENNA